MKSIFPLFSFILFFVFVTSAQEVITFEQAKQSVGTIYDPPVKFNDVLFSGIIKSDYKNGKPKLWVEVQEGRSNGGWIEWYPNGNFRFKSFWKDGKGHGLWQYFYESGKLRDECFVIEDIYNGISTTYYESGAIKQKTAFINNKKVGYEYLYAIDGSVQAVNKYKNGKLLNDRPRKFAPGVISTTDYNEWDITFMPDQQTLYFTRRMDQEKQKIYKSKKENGKWTAPLISEINRDRDEAIFYSAVNQGFYFASTKKASENPQIVQTDMNIWYKPLDGEYMKLPFNKDMIINVDNWPGNYETGPITDNEGNIYFWSGSPNGADADIYISLKSESFKSARPLSSTINTDKYESSPVISPDGKYLLFSSYQREDGLGMEDIYYSKKENGKWSIPKPLGPIVNSRFNESFARFSPDGKQFYFSSDREGNDTWSIYFIDTKYLGLE